MRIINKSTEFSMCASSMKIEAGLTLYDSMLSEAKGMIGNNFSSWASKKFIMA